MKRGEKRMVAGNVIEAAAEVVLGALGFVVAVRAVEAVVALL